MQRLREPLARALRWRAASFSTTAQLPPSLLPDSREFWERLLANDAAVVRWCSFVRSKALDRATHHSLDTPSPPESALLSDPSTSLHAALVFLAPRMDLPPTPLRLQRARSAALASWQSSMSSIGEPSWGTKEEPSWGTKEAVSDSPRVLVAALSNLIVPPPPQALLYTDALVLSALDQQETVRILLAVGCVSPEARSAWQAAVLGSTRQWRRETLSISSLPQWFPVAHRAAVRLIADLDPSSVSAPPMRSDATLTAKRRVKLAKVSQMRHRWNPKQP
jgi:hypothetical protein